MFPVRGQALQEAFWGSCAHASLQKNTESHLSYQLPEWCLMDQDTAPAICILQACGLVFAVTLMTVPSLTFHAHREVLAIEWILFGAFSNSSAALDGLVKLKGR